MAGFAEVVSEFSAKTQAKLETAVRKIALDVFSEVILMSPVDTGRFELTADMPATYSIVLDQFPFMPWSAEIMAT